MSSVAVELLGLELAAARRRQQRTAADVAERAGVTRQTLRRVERGDTSVAIGIVFDVATILGVRLFDSDGEELDRRIGERRRELVLLPSRVRGGVEEVDDDF